MRIGSYSGETYCKIIHRKLGENTIHLSRPERGLSKSFEEVLANDS
jgi:hypothetical protein